MFDVAVKCGGQAGVFDVAVKCGGQAGVFDVAVKCGVCVVFVLKHFFFSFYFPSN